MHAEHMRDLEAQAIRAKNQSHQDFLLAHQMLLHRASAFSQRGVDTLLIPFYWGHILHFCNTSPSPQHPRPKRTHLRLLLQPPLSNRRLGQSSLPKRWCSSEDVQEDTSGDEDFPPVSQEEHSNPKQGKMANWQTSMKSSRSDAFCWDSDLVKEARVCYFATHPWDWTQRNMNDLSDIFRGLAQSAGLLDKCIFEIQDSWKGPDHLKHPNYLLLDLPKGLKFLRAVSAKESPKIMGLKGIHDPEALRHFASYTFYPWCGKDRQNKGTIINHLRMDHYKLGLVCNLCFSCPTTSADTLHHHGCINCMT